MKLGLRNEVLDNLSSRVRSSTNKPKWPKFENDVRLSSTGMIDQSGFAGNASIWSVL